MKRVLLIFVIIMLFYNVYGQSNDSINNNIVGTWFITSTSYSDGSRPYKERKPSQIYIFNNDSTYIYKVFVRKKILYTREGRWNVNNGNLVLMHNQIKTTFIENMLVVDIQKDRLILKKKGEDDIILFMTFKKESP